MNPSSRQDAATAAFRDPLSGGGSDQQPLPTDFPFLEPASESGDLGQLGKYRVLRVLGQGGMGFVFAAEDTHLRRTVALKVMRPELAADYGFRERFLLEARASAQVASEYVVTVFEVGVAGDVPFIAMQLLNGESVQDRLQRDGPLPVNLATLVLRQAAEGLSVAHGHGMIHRDIKPANLWLEADKASGQFRRTKILDFGLARPNDQDTRLTASGVIVGTPHYMAPEQASGLAVDGRADLFSLGCVAYTMLTGKLAFDGSSTMAVLMALANHTPTPLCVVNLDVPPVLSELIARMMTKNKDLRPATADEVIAVLDEVLAGLPDPVHPARGTGSVAWSGATRQPAGGSIVGPAADGRSIASRSTPAPWTSGAAPSISRLSGAHATTPFGSPAAATQPNGTGSGMTAPPTPAGGGGRDWKMVAVGSIILCIVLSILLGVAGRMRRSDSAAAAAAAAGDPIPVGVLHSETGTMSLSESPVIDATQLAIDEVNAAGGVLGRQLRAVKADGQSDAAVFAREAEKLMTEQKVAAIFGCWTSASRKAVRPKVEQHNGLLFYPVQYEGLEQSPRIVYLGPAPNQQIFPAVDYLVDKLNKKKFFLVGSDYVYPRAAHEIVKDWLKARKTPGGRPVVVGEEFLPLGSKDVDGVVAAIKKAKPDVVLNTINGSTNFAFFRVMNADQELDDIPVMSFSLMETDLRGLDPKGITGDYLVGTYFQSVKSDAGREFLDKIRARFGQERTFSDPMAAAYSGVHLWAKAVAVAGTTDPAAVTKALGGLTYGSPVGYVRIDPLTQHTWLPCRIGRVRPDGQVEVASGSGDTIQPEPFPPTRTRAEWERFLNGLYVGWEERWQAPPSATAKP